MQVVNVDGKPLEGSDVVAPTNLFLHSLISKVKVKLNGRQVCSMNNYVYPYRAMLEILLSYGEDAKATHLECELCYKDAAGAMEDMDIKSVNEGFLDRHDLYKESSTIDIIGRLHHNIFQQEKLLLNKVDINITLTHSDNEFCLLSLTRKK